MAKDMEERVLDESERAVIEGVGQIAREEAARGKPSEEPKGKAKKPKRAKTNNQEPPEWMAALADMQRSEALRELFTIHNEDDPKTGVKRDLDIKTETPSGNVTLMAAAETQEASRQFGRTRSLRSIYLEKIDRRMISKGRKSRFEILTSYQQTRGSGEEEADLD